MKHTCRSLCSDAAGTCLTLCPHYRGKNVKHNCRWLDQLNVAAAIVWGSMFGFWIGLLIFIKECVS